MKTFGKMVLAAVLFASMAVVAGCSSCGTGACGVAATSCGTPSCGAGVVAAETVYAADAAVQHYGEIVDAGYNHAITYVE